MQTPQSVTLTAELRIEQDVENMKIELSQQEDFNLIDAYGLLDTHCQSAVSPS